MTILLQLFLKTIVCFLSYLPYCVKKFTNYTAVLLNPVNALIAESSKALLLTVRCFSSLLGSNPGRGI